ncbi:MAG: hypothetical protein AAFW47_07195 [Pseudomonadota bacterium]
MENMRAKQLAWVQAILEYRGWSQSTLAEKAGFNHTTLSKWKNHQRNDAQLSSDIVHKIWQVGGIPPYNTAPSAPARGFAEEESQHFDHAKANENSPILAAIDAIKAGRNAVDPWVLKSNALETAGYLRGDILMVDLGAHARPGDVVCAQLYEKTGSTKTIFRIFEPPYLVSSSTDRSLLKPILLDDNSAVVMGVVIASLRGELQKTAA